MPNSCRSGLSAEHTKKGELCLANMAPIFIKKQQTFFLQQALSQRTANFALCTGRPKDAGICPSMFAPKNVRNRGGEGKTRLCQRSYLKAGATFRRRNQPGQRGYKRMLVLRESCLT